MGKTFRQYVNEGGLDNAIYEKWLKDVEEADSDYKKYLSNTSSVYDTSGFDIRKKMYDNLVKRGTNIKNMISKGDISVKNVGDIDSLLSGLNAKKNRMANVAAYYKQFSGEDEFYNWSFNNKYKGKTVTDIDSIIASNDVNEREYNWLKNNRDSFMSTDEILSEINSLEDKSADLKKDKWLNRANYVGNLISGAFFGDTLRAGSYNETADNAVTENQARLQKLYDLAASREDFDAEKAYKEADEHNIFDVLKPDYTMADYRNDQSKKNVYGGAVVAQRDKKNLSIIENNKDEFKSDVGKLEAIVFNQTALSDLASSSLGNNLANALNPDARKQQIINFNPEIQSIIKKWADKGYDFESLYETYDRQVNADYAESVKERAREETQKNPVLGNVTSVGTNLIGGISALPSVLNTAIKDAATDDIVSLDTNAPEWALKNVTDEIRDTTSSMIAENNDGIKGEFYNFLYQTGMSMADMGASFVASGFNPTVYPVIMSSNAAADKIKTVTENGGSIDEALLSGLMAGAFEAVFEKVGIDKLVETVTSSAGKSVFKSFLNGFLSEGLEELGTDIANSVSDALINGDNSELNNSIYTYMQDGYSASEANAMALTDLAKQYMTSFAGGALSGGIIGGVGGGINSAIINRENSRLGKETISEGSTDYLMELAMAQNAAQNEDVQKAVSKINKYQGRQAEKLYKSTGKTEINNAVKDRLRVLGMEKGEIDTAAQEITDAYFKKNSKLKKFAENKTALRVLSELGSISQTDAQYTNEWASTTKNSLQEKMSDEARNKYRAKDIGAVRRAVSAVTSEYELQHQTFKTEATMTEKQKRLGAALTADTNKSVTVSRVLEKADGGMVVQLTNGQKGFVATEINAKSDLPQIKMKNTESNHLMTVASSYETPQTVNAFISAINENQDVVEYSKEFKTAYDVGLQNNDFNVSDFKVITKEQARLAYQSGMQDASISYVTAINDTQALFDKVKNESFSAGVTRLDNSKINNSYRIKTQLKVLNAYGKKHNLSFIIADSIETEQGSANGVYLGDNKIVISAKAEAGAILSVAGHEVYHYLEINNKKGAAALREWVLDYLSKSKDFNLEARRAELKKRYGAEADVDAEIVANSMFDVLSNEKAINSLAEENPSLLRNILKRIKSFIEDIKAIIAQLGEQWAEVKALSKDLQALESIRWLMESALSQIDTTSQTEKNTATGDGVVKYSIKTDIDGNKYVDIENRIFDKSNGKGHASIIAKLISEKFNNLIIINKQKIRINAVTNKEWRRSPDAQKLIRTSPDIYYDKLNAIQNADEILRVARNWVGEKIQHRRKDDIVEFARGIINYKIGDDGYSADILVATKNDGSALLYDILHIKEKIITDASRGSHSNTVTSRQDAPVKDTISQPASEVKEKFSYAGRRAKTANTARLEEAMRLEDVGKATAEEIRQQTGWFRGLDGKWRFEIDDSWLTLRMIKNIPNYTTLGELIVHDKLFEAYPELKDMRVSFSHLEGMNGHYNRTFSDIMISRDLKEAVEKGISSSLKLQQTLIHEIQHAIQHIEGFARGASVDYWEDALLTNDLRTLTNEEQSQFRDIQDKINRIEEAMPEFAREMRKLVSKKPNMPRGKFDFETLTKLEEDPPEWKHFDAERTRLENEYGQQNVWDYLDMDNEAKSLFDKKRTATDLYYSTAGEIEAFDTARRMSLDDSERMSIRPDVNRTDAVFADGNVSFSSQNIERYSEKEYNDYGWVAVNEVLTGAELKSLNSQFADATKLNYNYPKSPENEFMILVGDNPNSYEHLVYIKGDINHPIITQIIGVYSDVKKYQRNYLDEVIILNEQKIGNPFRIIENYAGEEIFFRLTLQDYPSYNELQKGRFGTESTEDSRGKQDGRRSTEADSESGMKLSLQSTDAAAQAREKLIKQNKNLQVANMLLKQELIQTHGKMLTYDGAKALAKDMKINFSSSYDANVLAEEIYDAFKWYDRTDMSTEQLLDYFTRVGEKVVAKSVGLERTLYDDYADARKWIREMEFTLPEHVLNQLNENHSGKFVLHTFGKMRYVSKETHPDAPYLSAIYSELASEYPNFFSEEDNEYEQPQKLLDFWQKIKPTYYNPLAEMGFDSPEKAAVSFAYILFNKYLNSEKLVTVADKQRNLREKLEREYSDNLDSALLNELWKHNKKLQQQKEYYINSRNKSSEERKKTLVKKKIQNVIKELDKYLNRGSKDKNVKLDMQETVTAALSSAEILFSETLENADIVRAGVENSPVLSSADGIEEKCLAEYAELLEKRDGYLRQLDIVNNQSLSEESLSARDGVEEMIKKADEKLKKLDKQLEGLFEREKRRIDKTSVDEALSRLAGAYKSIEDSEYSYISNSYDENVYNHIEFIRKELKGAKISLMNINQLDSVYEAYKMVLHTVRNANKIFAEGKQADVEALANDVMSEIKKVGGYRDRRSKIRQAVEKFGWEELKPIYAFRTIGSDTLTARYKAMRDGQNTYYRDMEDAKSYESEVKKKYNYGSWDLEKTYSFTSKSGKDFTLTLDEIMSLYAYSRRGEQAITHITRGGIVHSDRVEVKEKTKSGVVLKYNVDTGAANSIAVETFQEIVATLTDSQREYVEEMQKYLSDVMGEKGNEVSMKMYGVKLFKEKIYFPLKSSAYYKAYDGKNEGEVLLKNAGFTNATVPDANNPIVIDNFSRVWNDHVVEMSNYHAFVLPVEDFMRVFNYQTRISENSTDVYSVKATLQGAYGKAASDYIKTFIRDVNGGPQVQGAPVIAEKLTALSKKSAVFASLSVVIQQPSAVLRAVAYINPKYFLNALPKSINWAKVNKEYDELKKYAPVAGIKQMGYFDTGLGRSASDWLGSNEYDTFGQKITGFLKDGSYRDEVFAWLPGKADEISWVYIWNAVKQEVADSGKYSVGSQEYLQACGDRFTEVIELTQVYDSVFSRSGFMRNKNALVKMATSFMAEPTVQINMLLDAGIQGKRSDKKHTASVIGAVYASILANAMLKSIVTAGRDDDEDLNYGEKYIGNLVASFLQDGLMLSSIPFVRDIISIIQGYDVERMDMSVISNIISSFSSLVNENKTTWDKISGVAGSVASLIGIPLKNIMRDIEALINTFKTAAKDYKYSNRAATEAIIRNITNKSTAKGDLLYFATVNGDTEYANRLKSLYDDESSLNSAIRTALRGHDERISKAAQARIDGNIAEYMRIAKEIVAEKRFSQDNVVMAISAQVESLSAEVDSKSSSKRVKGYFTDDDYLVSVICGNGSTAKVVAQDLIKTDIANGKSEDEAKKQLVSNLRSNLKDAYAVGDVSFEQAVKILASYGDMEADEADNRVRYWEFCNNNSDISLTEESFIKFEDFAKPSGISAEVFSDYYARQSKCVADKDEDGKLISGSKKKKILDIINSLDISSEQKDALYYCSGYKESSIDDAPWH